MLVLRKCKPEQTHGSPHRIFEKSLSAVSSSAWLRKSCSTPPSLPPKRELQNEEWLRLMAKLSGRSYEQMRVAMLEFLDTDVFHVTVENCISFLDPMIDSWDIDLRTFAMELALNRRLAPGSLKRFEFVEQQPSSAIEPGLEQFLKDKSLSAGATAEEIEFLKTLKFKARRPSALYYYRELQNLRDPLHFLREAPPKEPPKQSSKQQPKASV